MIMRESDLRRFIKRLLFESEGGVYRVVEEKVEVVYPDSIDRDLLEKGDRDGEISGFVFAKDKAGEGKKFSGELLKDFLV